VVWVLAAIWILKATLYGEPNLRLLTIALPLLLITLYAFVQTAVWPEAIARHLPRLTAQRTLTIDRYQTFITARKMLALTVFFGLLLLHTCTKSRFRWLVRTVICLGLGSALFGIARQLLQAPDAAEGFVLPFLFPGLGYGQFISPNVFAYLMEMTLALVAALALGGGIRRDRILMYIAISIPIWAALVLSNSRGAILGLICAVVFILLYALNWYAARNNSRIDDAEEGWWLSFRNSTWLRVPLVMAIVAILVVGAFWMGGENLATKVQNNSAAEDTASGTNRREIWQATWQLIKSNRWTGVGFGSYFLAIPQYQHSSGAARLEQAHDDYLDLAANGGIVAVLLAGWFVLNVIRRTRVSFRSRDTYRRAACLGASAGLLSTCIHSFVDFGLQVTGIAVVFAVLIVISVIDEREYVSTAK
jgi:O-antigen ligase